MNAMNTLLIDLEQRYTSAYKLYMSLTECINKDLCRIESFATELLLIYDDSRNLIESKTIHSKKTQGVIDKLLKYRQNYLEYSFRQYFNNEEMEELFKNQEAKND